MPNWKPRNTERARELRNRATPAERHLWRHISNSRLGYKFSRPMPAGPFFAGFLCRQRKLIIEIDGFSHEVEPARDMHCDRYLNEAGYRVVHFPNAEVLANVEGVIIMIQQALGDRPTPNPSLEREGGGSASSQRISSQ